MNLVMIYLFKVSMVIFPFWLLYTLVFGRMTFFRFNRFFLLGGLFLSFLVPLIPLSSPGIEVVIPVFDEYYTGSNNLSASVGSRGLAPEPGPGLLSWAGYISLAISSIYLVGLLLQYIRLRKVQQGSLVLKRGRLKLVISDSLPSAFTLFRSVYIDRYTYSKSLLPVIRHEWVHAREGHTWDMIFMELVFALLWFNPFVFLFRKALRQNLEYLADEQSVDGGSVSGYLELLGQELVRRHEMAFANYFRSSTFKKRIMMLVKNKTDKRLRWSYLLLLPVFFMVLTAFHAQVPMTASLRAGTESVLPEALVKPGKNGVPHLFPLDREYRNKIVWDYGIEAKNPITGKLTTHGGVDISAPEGSPVYASADGVVSKVVEDESWGKLIILAHDNDFSTWYAHLSEFDVKAGDKISAGQVIAKVGSTGWSTGPHLHFEVRVNGERVDPNDYF